MAVTHQITLDIDKNRVRLDQDVHVRVGDVSSQTVACSLTKGGAAYTPASGTTAKLEILKPDNTWTVSDASVSGSTVSAVIPDAGLSCPGECKRAYFRLISSTTEDTTEDFRLTVFANATQEAIESLPYSDQIDALIQASDAELQASMAEVRDARTNSEGVAKSSLGDALRETDSAAKAALDTIQTVVSGDDVADDEMYVKHFEGSGYELSVSDDNGNNILIVDELTLPKTRHFDSEQLVWVDTSGMRIEQPYETSGMVYLADENGNVGAKVGDGFDSSRIVDTSRMTTMDLAIADELGNVLFGVENGSIVDQNTERLRGKTFSTLGDSISTFRGMIPSGYATYYPKGEVDTWDKTWWGQLIADTGMVNVAQAAWSGSRCCGNSEDTESGAAGCSDKRISDVGGGLDANPDFIIVYIGTNDFGLGTPKALGEFSPENELPAEGDIQIFSQAYALMLSKLREAYPLSRIVCCTLTEWRYVQGDDTYPVLNPQGMSVTSYNKRIKEIADAFSCTVCDTHACGLNHWNTASFTVDQENMGLHPNILGMHLIKDAIKHTLEQMI